MMNFVVDLFLRVFLLLVLTPHGVTGCRPPRVRPPSGWSTGFIASPRTWPRQPIQRVRPALPIEMFLFSGFYTSLFVAYHPSCTTRSSTDIRGPHTYSPS